MAELVLRPDQKQCPSIPGFKHLQHIRLPQACQVGCAQLHELLCPAGQDLLAVHPL